MAKPKPKYKKILNDGTILCNYGCGKLAQYQFNNGKFCCEKDYRSCSSIIKNRNNSKLMKTKLELLIVTLKKLIRIFEKLVYNEIDVDLPEVFEIL